MQAERVGQHRLDDVAVAAGQPDGVRSGRRGDPGVPLAHRGDRPGLRAGQRLPLQPGEHRRGRVGLHDLPQRLLGQVLERLAGPVAVPDLGQPGLDRRGQLAAGQHGGRGLHAPLQRAGHHRGQRHRRQSRGHRLGLRPAPLVEVHARRVPRQHRPGHRGEPVPDEQDRGHPAHSRVRTRRRPGTDCRRGRRGEHRHRHRGAGRQPGDRGREDRRRADRRVERDAGRGRALRRRHHQPGLPAHLAAAVPEGAGRHPPVRVRQGAVLLVPAGRDRDLRLRRGVLHLRGRARAAVRRVRGRRLPAVVRGAVRLVPGRGHVLAQGGPAAARGGPGGRVAA